MRHTDLCSRRSLKSSLACLFQGSPAGAPNRMMGSAGMRPVSLGHSGATGPRPITQSELATALALASTPESSAVTPTTSNQVRLSHLKRADESSHGVKPLTTVSICVSCPLSYVGGPVQQRPANAGGDPGQ